MSSMPTANPRQFLLDLYGSALDAASPSVCVPPYLPPPPAGRTVVIGAGKGAAAMARAVEAAWSGPLEGMVVTRYGHGEPLSRLRLVEAAHPVPDAAGQAAAQQMLEMVRGLSSDDLVLVLISGGGSSLLSLPAPGITLAQKQAINKALLRSGANIGEMNCVRKHLSAIKGGRLAQACAPAQVVTLVISDVPGDDPAVVASGPTLPDATTSAQALDILRRYRIEIPPEIEAHLQSAESETPKPGRSGFEGHRHYVISTARQSLEAAADRARAAGIDAYILSDTLEGEAREVGFAQAALARDVISQGKPFSRPCVLLSGGETTVTVRGDGRGGRNAEYLLGLAVALNGLPGVHALACDTDGIDGSEDNAGAVLGPDSLARAAALGLHAQAMLDNNDAYSFFSALGDLIITGPTRTNVNDFRAILIQ